MEVDGFWLWRPSRLADRRYSGRLVAGMIIHDKAVMCFHARFYDFPEGTQFCSQIWLWSGSVWLRVFGILSVKMLSFLCKETILES